MEQAAPRFDLLADRTRLRILLLLDREGESNGAERRGAVGLSQPGISTQVKLLRLGGYIESRQVGHVVSYRLPSLVSRDLLRRACRLVEDGVKET